MPNDHWQKTWLALDDYRLGLLEVWCERQSRVERRADWFQLSEAARERVEQANGLTDLDTLLRQMDRHLRLALRRLPTEPSVCLESLTDNLRIAERLLPPEENSVAHGLISRVIRDLPRIRDQW